VRNAGTVGGAIAHGDPAADVAAGVLALGAQLVLDGPDGEPAVAAEDCFLGPYTTALGQQELLVEIVVPAPAAGTGSAYVSFEDPASGYPLVGCAAVAAGDAVTIGLCGVGGRPNRPGALEQAIADGTDLQDALADLGDLDDYRAQLTVTAVERAVDLARRRAR
jgi:carbon-monoxide dehydrogenase medium subunit